MSVAVALSGDLPALLALEHSFPERERWSEPLWAAEITATDRHLVVARGDDDAVLGAATFQCVGDVADLHRIVVEPAHRRRGVAAALLSDGVAWATRSGAARMLLEVRHDNQTALGFYRAHGFTAIAERSDYYAPGAHAVVMQLTLTSEGTTP